MLGTCGVYDTHTQTYASIDMPVEEYTLCLTGNRYGCLVNIPLHSTFQNEMNVVLFFHLRELPSFDKYQSFVHFYWNSGVCFDNF